MIALMLMQACDLNPPREVWITEVVVEPQPNGDPMAFVIETNGQDTATAKCGEVAKCYSYETMNPLTDGSLTADRAIAVGGQTVEAGDDLSGLDLFVIGETDTGAWPNAFPRELYSGESYVRVFDLEKVAFASEDTTLTFGWIGSDDRTYSDTLTVVNGHLQ